MMNEDEQNQMKKMAMIETTVHSSSDEANDIVPDAIHLVKQFYMMHPEIKASHGWEHIHAVVHHTHMALNSLEYELPSTVVMEIKLAALLHDVDDKKYFPESNIVFANARAILQNLKIGTPSQRRILQMISWVGCSENGNNIPPEVKDSNAYHLLIPRWSDRLEAVGSKGVVRCYQYTLEKSNKLSSESSPRPQSEDELWNKYATPDKLQEYMNRGGSSTDMISHYYDKLLHIAKPPKDIVRNPYLENQQESSSKDLTHVCLAYGKSGKVDEEYIKSLMH